MFNVKHLEKRACIFEGFRSRPYKDTLDIWTVGFGATVWAGKKVTSNTAPVTRAQAIVEVRADLFTAIADCQRIYPDGLFDYLTDTEQEVLIHMAFQMGGRKLSKFERMTAAIQDNDADAWVREMKDSLWYTQTPRPANALMDAIANDQWQGQWNMG